MGADKLAENTTNDPKFICLNCLPRPKVWGFDEKRLHWASVVRVYVYIVYAALTALSALLCCSHSPHIPTPLALLLAVYPPCGGTSAAPHIVKIRSNLFQNSIFTGFYITELYALKVSKSQKQFLELQSLPKN
jgi:hypothetical protein